MGAGVQPVQADREVAAQMLRASLRGSGLARAEIEAIAQDVRRGGDGDGDGGHPAPESARETLSTAVERLRQRDAPARDEPSRVWTPDQRHDGAAGRAVPTGGDG
jgi:hypothetical protein